MQVIDLRRASDPDAVLVEASQYREHAARLNEARELVTSAGNTAVGETAGSSSKALVLQLQTQRSSLDDLSAQLDGFALALEEFASAIRAVYRRFDSTEARARTAGLHVLMDQVQLVPMAVASDDADAVSESQRREQVFQELSDATFWDREAEAAAHEQLQRACKKLDGCLDDLLRDEVLPGSQDAAAVGRIGDWVEYGHHSVLWGGVASSSRFAPRWPAGKVIDGKNVGGQFRQVGGRWNVPERWARTNAESWVPKPGRAGSFSSELVDSGIKAEGAAKWFGRAGGVVGAAAAGWEQYQEDSANPSMGEGERFARAGIQGVVEGAGAWGGAWAGAQLGGTIGAFGGPVGIAVGGVLGGIIGGVVGSKVGDRLADLPKDALSSSLHDEGGGAS